MFRKLKIKYKYYIESRFKALTGLNLEDATMYRANRILTLIVMGGLSYLAVFIYSYHPKLATLLNDGFLFFHFPKIFNLKTPDSNFFQMVASYLLISLIGFHFLSIQLILLEYLFSFLYISKKQKIIIYVQSNLFFRKIHILKDKKIQYELSDNLLIRILGIGTLNLFLGNGEVWKIKYISRAKYALAELLSFEKK